MSEPLPTRWEIFSLALLIGLVAGAFLAHECRMTETLEVYHTNEWYNTHEEYWTNFHNITNYHDVYIVHEIPLSNCLYIGN